MRLERVPNDDQYRMYCPKCGVTQTKFRIGNTEVEVHSEASTMPMIAYPDKTHQDFKEGLVESVTCAKCGTTYRNRDAHSTT